MASEFMLEENIHHLTQPTQPFSCLGHKYETISHGPQNKD